MDMAFSDTKLLFVGILYASISLVQAYRFQVFNRHSGKCLSFQSGVLGLERCTTALSTAQSLEWTNDQALRQSYYYYQTKCIQVTMNGLLTVSDCQSKNTAQWICEGNLLRLNDNLVYLSWNPEKQVLQLGSAVKSKEGQWLVYKSDNNICEYLPRRSSTTAIPFTQPTQTAATENSAQLWPQGIYALPKAANGCPTSTNFTWQEGWIFQDLDDTGEIKTKSSGSFNMAANIDEYGNIKRWFCSKNAVKDGESARPMWPKGTYCIYRAGSSYSRCPEVENGLRFSSGYASWDDQDVLNNSKEKGIVPYGSYRTYDRTTIHFCCQENADPNKAVYLPTDQPFYLIAYRSSVCQKVQWATVISEFIIYDTSDYLNNDYHHSEVYPFNFPRIDPKIYYCYYQGCNHTVNTLQEKEGEVWFPESPFMDITGQSCSWRILIPSQYILTLTFSYFNIPSNVSTNCSSHYVEIFECNNHSQRSTGRWCGYSDNFSLNFLSQSVLIVLKIGHDVTNTTGFHLIYKAITTSATTVKSTSPTTQVVNSSPAAGRQSSQNVPTAAIVVSVVLTTFIGLVLSAFLIVRKRLRNNNGNVVTEWKAEDNVYAQSNPVYEGELKDKDEEKYCNVTIYESTDGEPTAAHNTMTKQLEPLHDGVAKSMEFGANEENPLYESSEKTEYSLTENSLYGDNDP